MTTLHAALGLRPVREEGVETFQPDPRATPLIGEHTVLVVLDQTSMVSTGPAAQLEEAMQPGAALVAIGDPAQLQPVDDSTPCPLLEAPISAHLSEVVRHAGPILELATATRNRGSGRPPFTSSKGAIDAVRVLSWSNAAAEKFNRLLRRAIYGPDAPPWVAGQLVVSSGVILGPDGAPLVGSTGEMELRAPMHAGVIKSSPRAEHAGRRSPECADGQRSPPWRLTASGSLRLGP